MNTPAQPTNFREMYALLHPKAHAALSSVNEVLHQRRRFSFWPNEEVIIADGRVKDGTSLKNKMGRKKILYHDLRGVCDNIRDVAATRIVVTFRSQITRAVEMILHEQNPWSIPEECRVAYTDDPDDADLFRELGLKVERKATGYAGVHLDLIVDLTNNPVHWVEIQIRTKIQDAWESIDHLLYKTGDDLPASFLTLRKSLAGQFEASEKGQGFIFDYVQDEIVAKHPEKKFTDYFQIFDWSKNLGAPIDLIGKVIHGRTLDCYYLVDENLGRRTLVEDATAWPQKLITKRWLEKNRQNVLDQAILLPDEFLADMTLCESISINEI